MSGRVLREEDDAAIASATVRLAVDLPANLEERDPARAGRWLQSLQSDQEGMFRFDDLRPARYRLHVSHPGYLDQHGVGVLAGEHREVRLTVDPGILCRVERLGEESSYRDAVRVPVSLHEFSLEAVSESWYFRGLTDEGGRCLLSGIPQTRFEELLARDLIAIAVSGFIPVSVEKNETDGDVRYAVLVRRGSVVQGQVFDHETRRPISGASVFSDYGHAVVTDLEGRYAIRGVGSGLNVSAEGYALRSMDVAEHLAHGRSSLIAVDAYLDRGLVLQGRVVDPDGHPLEGIRVGIAPFELDLRLDETRTERRLLEELGSTTDEDGRYVIRGVPADALDLPGSFDLELRPPGTEGGVLREISVEDEEGPIERDLELDLARGPSGTVLDRDGSPLAGARVTLAPLKGPFFHVTATDSRGGFGFPLVPRGEYLMGIEAGERPVLVDRVTVPVEDLRVRIEDGRSLWGRVVSEADGLPLPGLIVRLVLVDRAVELALETRTDGSGGYSFMDVCPGEFRLELMLPRPALAFDVRKPRHVLAVDLARGDLAMDIRYPTFPGGDVVLRFLLADGERSETPNETVQVQVDDYQLQGFALATLFTRYTVAKGAGSFRRRFRTGDYTFRCLLSTGGVELEEEVRLSLEPEGVVERDVVFTLD